MAVTFGTVWKAFLDIIWIIPGNIIAPAFYFICYLILQLLSRFIEKKSNFQEFSALFIDLIKLNLLPRWTDITKSKKKEKVFDQNSKYAYIFLCGIPSFIYHIFCAITNLFLCVFIFPAIISYPFVKIHLKLAITELYPFCYEFTHNKPYLKLEETDYESDYSRKSSAYSSREPTPTPTRSLALK